MDEFSKKLQRGGVGRGSFSIQEIILQILGLYTGLWSGEKDLHYDFPKTRRGWVKGRSELFRKFNSVLVPPPFPYAAKRSRLLRLTFLHCSWYQGAHVQKTIINCLNQDDQNVHFFYSIKRHSQHIRKGSIVPLILGSILFLVALVGPV